MEVVWVHGAPPYLRDIGANQRVPYLFHVWECVLEKTCALELLWSTPAVERVQEGSNVVPRLDPKAARLFGLYFFCERYHSHCGVLGLIRPVLFVLDFQQYG